MNNIIDGRIKRLLNGIRQAFRGKLATVDSSPDTQRMQLEGLDGEVVQAAEHVENFGFTSNPPPGSDVIVIPIGGKTSHGIVVATASGAFRVKGLAAGEVAIYDQSGSTIIMRQGRVIDVDCDEYNVTCKKYSVTASDGADFTTPALATSAVLSAEGQVQGNGGMSIKGGDGATFTGNVNQVGGSYHTDGDVVAGTVSLKSHTCQN